MSMMDYGVIAKKNKKILTENLFTPMQDTLGFTIEKDSDGYDINGNYFVYLGDRDFYVAIYKCGLHIFSHNEHIKVIYGLEDDSYYKGKKYSLKCVVKGVEFNIKRIDEGNRYYGSFSYKGDFYDFIYGYGVDTDIRYWYDKSNKAINKVKRFYRNTL